MRDGVGGYVGLSAPGQDSEAWLEIRNPHAH